MEEGNQLTTCNYNKLTYPSLRIALASSSLKDMIRGVSSWYPLTILSNKSAISLLASLSLSDLDISPSTSIAKEFSECVALADSSSGFGNVKSKHLMAGSWFGPWPWLTFEVELSCFRRFISSIARARSVAVYLPWRIPGQNSKY